MGATCTNWTEGSLTQNFVIFAQDLEVLRRTADLIVSSDYQDGMSRFS